MRKTERDLKDKYINNEYSIIIFLGEIVFYVMR